MSFSGVAEEVFGLYHAGRFGDALAVVESARDRFPSRDATFTFWEACLLSMGGSPDAALSVLREGLERDLWWSEAMLADSDLDAVRLLESWAEFLSQSDDRAKAAAASRPEPLRRAAAGSEPRGVIVALHGAQASPRDHADEWEVAVPEDWAVIVPVGGTPATVDRWSWPLAADEAVEAALGQLRRVDWDRPVVLCGYSQGGRVALDLAAEPSVRLHGLMLIAPAVRAEALPSVPDVPTYIHIGDQDWALDGVNTLARVMGDHGTPVRVEGVADFYHAMPRDLTSVLDRALSWISASHTP